MISLRYYLDARRPSRRPDGKFCLKLAVTKRGVTALMPVMAYASREEWDADRQRLRGPSVGDAGKLNTYLAKVMLRAEDMVRDLIVTQEGAAMTAFQVRDRIAQVILDNGPGISLGEYYDKVAASKTGEATRQTFINARAAIARADPRLLLRPVSSVTPADVARVDAWMWSHFSANTRNGYMAKLTHVLRRAHQEGLNAEDAGRDVEFRYVVPKSRALTVEQLRRVFALEPRTRVEREALALLRLSFYLRGMNPMDIRKAGPNQIFNGRLAYVRSKTGKDYSVKLESEANELIAEWGNGDAIFAPLREHDYHGYVQNIDKQLKRAALAAGLPPVTLYWARHTFASLLIEIGYTMEVVAGALGHSYGPRVTAGYVTLQQRQVDDAVRHVFDYVGKGTK